MYRTHNCGELNINDLGKEITLSGWVQKNRNLGKMIFIDLRDREGVTQLVFDQNINEELYKAAENTGREYVIRITGKVIERESKNMNIPTGEIEIICSGLEILNKSETPPFTIQDNTDGGEELRLKYRYLDLRRPVLQNSIILRHKMKQEVRNYLNKNGFLEIETPVLIKSTPEGARDFLVPSRMEKGAFYALPQSPQLFKQLLMVSGFEKYYQIVKCFRDEDFRADRQPEFTQIDCEMAFVEQNDVMNMFEGLAKHLFKTLKGIDIDYNFPKIDYDEAMNTYGNDRPDIRFDMKIYDLTNIAKGRGFNVFDSANYIGGICAENSCEYTRKQLDKLTDFVKKPQIGAKGLVYVKYNTDGSFKSSVDKFYSQEDLKSWADYFNAKPGDLLLILSGDKKHTLNALSELRLEMGRRLELIDNSTFKPLWIINFPLFEKDEETGNLHAVHHPFTSPITDNIEELQNSADTIKAKAYDMVINGVEIGGGSIRIHKDFIQEKIFELMNFSKEEINERFGFLTNAFKYGAPPHGGIAFGLDRWVSIFTGSESIRDVIAFPKNNSGKDIMIDAPSQIDNEQLDELNLSVKK